MPDSADFWAPPRTDPLAESGPLASSPRPGVVIWFRVYSGLMALIYLVVAVAMGAVVVIAPASPDPEDELAIQLIGGVLSLVGGGLAVVFGIAPFLPRRPWVWVYDLALIALGLTSFATWPATIPLLIYWIRKPTQRYFGYHGA
jgi:hypothetical protein